jgi:hypothetical protein
VQIVVNEVQIAWGGYSSYVLLNMWDKKGFFCMIWNNRILKKSLILKTKFEEFEITKTSFILYITIYEINVGISRNFKYSWNMFHKPWRGNLMPCNEWEDCLLKEGTWVALAWLFRIALQWQNFMSKVLKQKTFHALA